MRSKAQITCETVNKREREREIGVTLKSLIKKKQQQQPLFILFDLDCVVVATAVKAASTK